MTRCLLCEGEGRQLYAGLNDRLFSFPGEWGFNKCDICGLVWLDPIPTQVDLANAYTTYYTHDGGTRLGRLRDQLKRALFGRITGASKDQGWTLRQLGAALNWIPTLRELGNLGTMCLGQARKGKLLDVGCGNGRFLDMMREAGWEVTGIEPDHTAAAIARKRYGITVIEGPIKEAALPPASYDAITLNHVIEHVPDPVALLAECRRLLKVDGTMVVTTPNIESLGHRLLSDAWVHLDPPRHLFLFSRNTLRSCCEKAGFCIEVQRTTFRNAAWTWLVGQAIRREGRYNGNSSMFARISSLLFLGREISALRQSPHVGEELLIVASPSGIKIPAQGPPHSIDAANGTGGTPSIQGVN